MKARSLFIRENRNFLLRFVSGIVAQIAVMCEQHLATVAGQIVQQPSRIRVGANCEKHLVKCALCLKALQVTPVSESNDYELLDHKCGGNVAYAMSILFADSWICGETRDFARVWASNHVLFTKCGLSEWQAQEAYDRGLREEISPSQEDHAYFSTPFYSESWRDSWLDSQLEHGYVFEGGIDKYRWAKN